MELSLRPCSPRCTAHTQLSMPQQAHLRSVVVDGQWTQLRKYLAARSLCALCGNEVGSLTHRHVRCSEVLDVELRNMPGPFYSADQPGILWKHESFASRALLPSAQGASLCLAKRAGKVTAACSRELSTEMAQPTRDKTLTSALRVWGMQQTQQPSSPSRFLERCRTSSKMSTGQSSSPSPRAPAQYVTDSSFVEQSVNQRGRKATERGRTCGGTFGAKSMLGKAWATASPCVRLRRTPLPRRYARVLSLLTTGLVMAWPIRIASWWFSSTVPRGCSSGEALGQPGRHMHGSMDRAQ